MLPLALKTKRVDSKVVFYHTLGYKGIALTLLNVSFLSTSNFYS